MLTHILAPIFMDIFSHEVLGDIKTENYWFKVLSSRMLLRIILSIGISLFGLNVFPVNGFFVSSYVVLIVYTFAVTLLQIIRISPSKYLKGGGYTYYEYIKRRFSKKRFKGVYVLGLGCK